MGIKAPFIIPSSVALKGSWDADANSPALASGTGTEGDCYLVSKTGATALDGIGNWTVNDFLVFASGAWHHAGELTGGFTKEVQSAKASVSSSAFKTSFTTPVQLIAAPGAGKAIQLLSTFVKYTYGTAAYVVADRLGIYYHGTYTGVDSKKENYEGAANATIFPVSSDVKDVSIENLAIDFRSQTSNPTTGDGTFEVYLTYKVLTL